MNAGIRAYHRLRVALARFGCRFDELGASRRRQVETEAAHLEMVENAVLASSEAGDVSAPDTSCDAALAEMRARYEDEDAFVDDLRRNGLTPDDLRTAIRRELTVEAVLAKCDATVAEATEAECDDWYCTHRDRFIIPETRSASHILVTVNAAFADNTSEAAHARITSIAAQVFGDPGRFEELAQRHSECPSALDGGRLGAVPRGRLYPALDAALFALCTGEISGVLESEAGFHILRCDGIEPPRLVPFAEAHARIREAIDTHRRSRARRSWIASLMSEAQQHAGVPACENRQNRKGQFP